jgi:hypothetical protein
VKYDFRVITNRITSIPNFVQIHLAVLELNDTSERKDRHVQLFLRLFHVYCAEKTHNNILEYSLYRKENTKPDRYKDQLVNAV